MPDTLSAREAADALGVSVTTLYAYVSRGLIRSEARGTARERRYRAEDVKALVAKKEERREPGRVAERALQWGAPVLESGISLIEDGKLYYRGREAIALAANHTLEEVAALIWDHPFASSLPSLWTPRMEAVLAALGPLDALPHFQVLLPLAAAEDPAAWDLRPAAVAQAGCRIVRLLAGLAAGQAPGSEPVARLLQQAWLPGDPGAARLLDAAMILAADHELNVSAFTARCVASAESTAYAAVSAGLGALAGRRHGGHSARVEALFAETAEPARAQAVLAARLQRGEGVPGFGQPLYPTGDPRGLALLTLASEVRPDARSLPLATALAEAAEALLGERPTIDFGLVALAQALGLPPGAPLTLFALGRTVGWIGHAIEQYAGGGLIRPRAHYVGARPQTE